MHTKSSLAESLLARADEFVVSAEKAADALPKPAYKGPTKPCPRCDGHGSAQFCGPDRDYGICFKCQGKGVVGTDRAALKACAEAHTAREVERLRVLYRGVRSALRLAKEAHALGGHWSARATVQGLESQLVRIEEHGRIAAAKECA